MRPIFKKNKWLIPVTGFLMILLSPVALPVIMFVYHFDTVKGYYGEAISAIKGEA
jgi:hypothetical protein